ncbi:MAG TPA: phosphopantetheine-binding protein [bacterium]|nr:phosphopantetheine-binding protein [bacterium]
MEKLLQIINAMLAAKNRDALVKLERNFSLRNDIGFDSLDLAEITVRVEDAFGVDIFEDGIVDTIGDVLERIGK